MPAVQKALVLFAALAALFSFGFPSSGSFEALAADKAPNIPVISQEPSDLTASGPVIIDGKDGVVIEKVAITSTSGPCVRIINSKNITIRDSEIGKCGGNGIEVFLSSNVKVVDSYIHPEFAVTACCDRGDAIYSHSTTGLLIQGNVIAYGETNVELMAVTDSQVAGNFLLNPQGPMPRGAQVQVWSYGSKRSSNVTISDNYALSSRDPKYGKPESQTDALNIGYTDGAIVRNNYVTGGQYPSGCGLVADDSANSVQFLNNTLLETGQCGLGIGSGTNQKVDGNKIYAHGLNRSGVGNTALYVWQQYSAGCGPVSVTNNTAVLIRPDGSMSSYWKGSGCEPTTATGNVLDQAANAALTPVATKLPAPSIPPRPYANLVSSPFTKQGC